MEPKADVNLTIDGKTVKAPEGTTILEAAHKAGINIPTLCHHTALTPYGGCRLCIVQVDGSPRLAASCVMPVRQGMEVVTENEAITEARRTILEFLFSERGHYCMFCAQSGDCELQDLAYRLQMDHLTVQPLGREFPTDNSHPDLVLDHNRCVLCGRCVRACRELVGAAVLDFHNRGGDVLVGVDLSGNLGDSSCVSCGLCWQVCPTGAIFLRHRTHYAVHGKSRNWREVKSHCSECELLCSTSLRVKDNNLIRIEGCLSNGGNGPDRGQLCRRGRLAPFKNETPRQTKAMVRRDGRLVETSLREALTATVEGLTAACASHGHDALFGLISSAASMGEIDRFITLAKAMEAGYVDVFDGRSLRNLTAAGGNGALPVEAPWSAIEEADLIVQIGPSFSATHPVVVQLALRVYQEKKSALAVIGPENPLVPWAMHLKAEVEDLPLLLEALAKKTPVKATGRGWSTGEYEAIEAAWAKAEKPVIIAGPRITGLDDNAALKALFNLAGKDRKAGAKARLIFLKSGANWAHAWNAGAVAAKPIQKNNKLKAGLVDMRGEEDWERAMDVLPKNLEFLAVMTPYASKTVNSMAHVIIPKPVDIEEEGHFISSAGSDPILRKKALDPPPGVQAAFTILGCLIEELIGSNAVPGNSKVDKNDPRSKTGKAGKGS